MNRSQRLRAPKNRSVERENQGEQGVFGFIVISYVVEDRGREMQAETKDQEQKQRQEKISLKVLLESLKVKTDGIRHKTRHFPEPTRSNSRLAPGQTGQSKLSGRKMNF